ncbi:MAG: hypothetical protein EOP88_28505, partial [Verrucomicrobiaceae bacterium]
MKILLWFFGNLALLAVVGWLLVQHQLRGGLDSLLAGSAGDRIRSFATLALQELGDTPRGQWDTVLARFETAYPLKLTLFNERAEQVAGAPIKLTPEVRSRLTQLHPPRPDTPERGPRRPRPGPPPPGDYPPPRGDFEPPANDRQMVRPAPEIAAFLRSEDPRRYWVILRAGMGRPGREGRLALVITSETLSAGGLFFDPKPLLWVGLGALALSVLFWLPLVRGIARSVAAMHHATARIAEGRFDVRVSERRRDLGVAPVTVKVAAANWKLRPHRSDSGYFGHLHDFVSMAHDKGADILVLPELHILELLSLARNLKEHQSPKFLSQYSA